MEININCTRCAISNVVAGIGHRTQADAVAAWNRRTATAMSPIITRHISPYHAVQGTEVEVRRIVGRLPGDPPEYWHRCDQCHRSIGYTHQSWCPEDGVVTEAQTYGGRHG